MPKSHGIDRCLNCVVLTHAEKCQPRQKEFFNQEINSLGIMTLPNTDLQREKKEVCIYIFEI